MAGKSPLTATDEQRAALAMLAGSRDRGGAEQGTRRAFDTDRLDQSADRRNSVSNYLTTNVLSWADVFRLGHRRDHISSIFGLGSNISIISIVFILYRHGLLSYSKLILIYHVSPPVLVLLSFLQLFLSRGFRLRLTVSIDECIRTLLDSTPLVAGVTPIGASS